MDPTRRHAYRPAIIGTGSRRDEDCVFRSCGETIWPIRPPFCCHETTLTPNRSTLDYIRDQLSQLLVLADQEGDHVLAAHISLALARADERLTVVMR